MRNSGIAQIVIGVLLIVSSFLREEFTAFDGIRLLVGFIAIGYGIYVLTQKKNEGQQ